MSIAFDASPPRGPRRAVSAPHSSLLNRIQKPPLADRIRSSADDSDIKESSGPYVLIHHHFPRHQLTHLPLSLSGPTRSKPPRRGGRGGGRGGGSAGGQRAEPKKPKTAEELDKELDAFFMADEAGATAAPVDDKAPQPTAEQDVEMA